MKSPYWQTLLKKTNMLQVNEFTSKSGEVKYLQSELENVHLAEDFGAIFYRARSKEELDANSITSVLSGSSLPGWIADNCAALENFDLQRCFSIVITTDKQNCSAIHLVANTADTASCWVNGLHCLIQNRAKVAEGEARRNLWLGEIFKQVCHDKYEQLPYDDVQNFFKTHISLKINNETFRSKTKDFLRMNKRKERPEDFTFNKEDFIEFYKFISKRKEVDLLFRNVSSNGAWVTVDDLEDFMTKDQRFDVTHKTCKELIKKFEVSQRGKAQLQLGIDGFLSFINSQHASLFNPAHEKIYQDMNQPLSHYFIASSHNTYLLGHQLKGSSSVQAYRDVLERGCRCVELDCWDGDDEEPIVYHGHTLTSKVLFKDIVQAIKESAFKVSPYPVIVSLENHCSVQFQIKMAEHLKGILGSLLYTTPVDFTLDALPSPKFFLNKILVRGKTGKSIVDDKEMDKEIDSFDRKVQIERSVQETDFRGSKVSNNNRTLAGQDTPKSLDDHLSVASLGQKLSPQSSPRSRRRKMSWSRAKEHVADELSQLINYISNEKFKSFIESMEMGHFSQTHSFVESEMLYFLDKSASEFVEFNKHQISRIYPGNLRVDSSNYDPIKPWTVGCQIVALNHQTNSEEMQLHYGKFRQNGNTGYVLKPKFLRDPELTFDPDPQDGKFPGIQPKRLQLTVISAFQLLEIEESWSLVRDEPDPYVQVEVHGVPADKATFTTHGLTDTTLNPVWNEEFQTIVHVPELAMVQFVVYDEDYGFDDFLGQVVIPFESLMEGYRQIQLLDMSGLPLPGTTLFVHVKISDTDLQAII
ncbi:1-phosphatidylinositol 4,5-bisphosphate phosphodiesterase delta-4 [Nematostella vectensis]|uniref:1-phosphatidylinositol 4,5-bisphosphate phosphodiesterase delta-4 n=1 Tax=Nematostella vectensis TaxID=45351 RepID=UPI00139047C1|nr:1-phosphatidylinositol 4,5-bisphosphate phosphodiesterase delta-4 [Nematostella vectensis]